MPGICGVTGYFAVCGNAGEGCSLTNAIRCRTRQSWRLRFREVEILALELADLMETDLLDDGPNSRMKDEPAKRCMLDGGEKGCVSHTSWFTGTGVSWATLVLFNPLAWLCACVRIPAIAPYTLRYFAPLTQH